MREIKRLTVPAFGLAEKLDPERRQLLAICGSFFVFEKGERIIEEGAMDSALYLVLKGTLSPHRRINEHSYMPLGSLKRGASFGEVNLFHPFGARATVIAMTDGELWKIDKVQLDAMLENDLVIAREVLSWLCLQMARRIRRADERYIATKEEYDAMSEELQAAQEQNQPEEEEEAGEAAAVEAPPATDQEPEPAPAA